MCLYLLLFSSPIFFIIFQLKHKDKEPLKKNYDDLNDIEDNGLNPCPENDDSEQVVVNAPMITNYPKDYMFKGLKFQLPNHPDSHALWNENHGKADAYHLAYQNLIALRIQEQIESKNQQWHDGMVEYLSMIPVGKTSDNSSKTILNTDSRNRAIKEVQSYTPTEADVASFVSSLSNVGGVTSELLPDLMVLWDDMLKNMNHAPYVSLMELVLLTPSGYLLKNERNVQGLLTTRVMSPTVYQQSLTRTSDTPFGFRSPNSATSPIPESPSLEDELPSFAKSQGIFEHEEFKLEIGGIESYSSYRPLTPCDHSVVNQILLDYYDNVVKNTATSVLDDILDSTSQYYLDLYRYYQVLLKKLVVQICKSWVDTKSVPDSILNVVSHMGDNCDEIMKKKNEEFSLNCVVVDLLTYLLVQSGKTTSIGVYALLKLTQTRDQSGYFDINKQVSKLFATEFHISQPLLPLCKSIISSAKRVNGAAVAAPTYTFLLSSDSNKPQIINEAMVMVIILGMIEKCLIDIESKYSMHSSILLEAHTLLSNQFNKRKYVKADDMVTELGEFLSKKRFSVPDTEDGGLTLAAHTSTATKVKKNWKQRNKYSVEDAREILYPVIIEHGCTQILNKKDSKDFYFAKILNTKTDKYDLAKVPHEVFKSMTSTQTDALTSLRHFSYLFHEMTSKRRENNKKQNNKQVKQTKNTANKNVDQPTTKKPKQSEVLAMLAEKLNETLSALVTTKSQSVTAAPVVAAAVKPSSGGGNGKTAASN
jgi:hypothetical protein